ncbi:MAG: hypothetical protein QGG53_24025 [Planctomycetota bacterium]|jgi:hypothetical protein|nr:hypothetical protein [Planctomycetota bacterium]
MAFFAFLCVCLTSFAEEFPLRFYAPFDGHTRGVLLPENVGFESPNEFERIAGVVGAAAAVPEKVGILFPIKPFLSHKEGTVAVWLKINWAPKETATRGLINFGRFGWLWRWTHQQFLQFSLFYHHLDERHDYGCQWKFRDWRPGQWRHFAITWSWSKRKRVMYIDGAPVAEAAIKRIPNVITEVRLGPDADGADELVFYSRAVDAAEVRRLYEAGKAGKPAFRIAEIPPAQGALARLPKSKAPRPPQYVNWSFDGAEQSDNGLRGEVTLNGWWRWQRGNTQYEPPDDTKWLFRKAPAQSSFTESFRPHDEHKKIVQPKDPRVRQFKLNAIPQWYEREFVVPEAWARRRILLKFDSFTHESAIWLDGKLIDALPRENLGGEYDVTDRVRKGEVHRLTVFSSGIDGETVLASLPATATIDDAWLVTSWRKKQVEARLQLLSTAARASVRVDIFDGDAKTPVKRLTKSVALAAGVNQVRFVEAWPDAKPWSLTQPHLYSYVVTLLDEAGKPLDATLPVRFGFREIWIDGGDFYLNGRPVHFIGHSNVHIVTAGQLGDPKYIRYSLRRWKHAGLNCLTPWGHSRGGNPTFHPLFDAADELGMAIFLKPDLPTGERGGETPKLRAYWHKLQKRYNKRYRQHPSALAWLIGSGSHSADFCPAMLDGKTPASVAKAVPLRKTWDFVRSIDETRPIFGLSNGDIGPVWTSMAYEGFDVDLQERENWPLLWSRTKHKPLMPCEFSLPCHPDWYTRTRGRSSRAQYHPEGRQSIPTEYGAMYLGPSVYAKEPEEFLKIISDSPGRPKKSNAFWETKLLFADTLRAWRAYGMSFVYHAEVPSLFTGERPQFPTVAGLDPRRRGATAENLHGSLQAGEELSEFGKRVKAATAPAMAYIGGPDGEFTLKDHAYYAGDAVRKVLVVVNETDEMLRVDGKWELLDRGRVLISGRTRTNVQPGRQDTRSAPIEFPAPSVQKRTDCTLVVSAAGIDVPAFALTVFPRAEARAAAAQGLVLFDPVGDTTKALKEVGVSSRPMPGKLTPGDRLVVGRGVLMHRQHRDALGRAGFDAAVAGGMRALMMEQRVEGWDGTLMGLRFKRLATRRAFMRAAGHPALAGLADADFKHLAGHSNFIEAYERPATALTSYPLHWWHWGNDNIVATYAIERPQAGAARALLVCGFDLGETALLEIARGDGLILFCQVDVTNRVGRDPVSTRLLGNLLAYVNSDAPSPSGPPLSKLSGKNRAADEFTGYLSPPPPVMGIHEGDLFFRGKLTLPAFGPKSPHPLFARVKDQGKDYWITSLTGAELPTPWQRAKRGRIEAALRMANRERVSLGPTLTDSDNRDRLYPHNWQRIDTLKGDCDPYVYWRW